MKLPEKNLTTASDDEERSERLKDKNYWLPLKREFEKMLVSH